MSLGTKLTVLSKALAFTMGCLAFMWVGINLSPVKEGKARVKEYFGGEYVVQQYQCNYVGCSWEERKVTRNFEEAKQLMEKLDEEAFSNTVKTTHY